MSIFDSFTHKYSLSKTLRFELKPIGKTLELIKQNKILEQDKFRDDNYHRIKFYFDLLHRRFLEDALPKIKLDYTDYYNNLNDYLETKDEKTKYENYKKLKLSEDELRKHLVNKLNEIAEDWKNTRYKTIKLKDNGIKIFFENANLDILNLEFQTKPDVTDSPDIVFTHPVSGEKTNLFEFFKGFHTYFVNFNQSRENFYSEKDDDTAIANRAINENLRRFCDNLLQYQHYSKEYTEAGVTSDEAKLFKPDSYNSCLCQKGIDLYNKFLGIDPNATDNDSIGLNQKVNLYRQKTKSKLPIFKPLYNQILGGKERKDRVIEITDDKSLLKALQSFAALNHEKISLAKVLMENFFNSPESFQLSSIYLNSGSLNTISYKWFRSWDTLRSILPLTGIGRKNTDGQIKLPDFVSLSQILDAFEILSQQSSESYIRPEDIFNIQYVDQKTQNHRQVFFRIWCNEWQNTVETY